MRLAIVNRTNPASSAKTVARTLLAAVLVAGSGCQGDPLDPGPGPEDSGDIKDADRPLGASAFISADGYQGQDSGGPNRGAEGDDMAGEDPSAEDGGGEEERTVEEGDIYRVLGNGLIANLNSYRGLQLIDITDVTKPEIIGRLQISGYPVEMYVRGDTAFILMNNWYGYYGGYLEDAVDQWYGGVAISVDISDHQHPVLLSRARIPGNITKSRITYGTTSAALYVVTGGYGQWGDDGSWETRTVVQSFDVADGMLTPKTELNLGGYVTDVQATPEALLVARYDWNDSSGGSDISVIDISDPTGVMVEGDTVHASGYVDNQFNMDLYEGILRVVSGSWWGGNNTNHVETFDATSFSNLVPIDHVTFAPNEQLYATLFRGDKAFFVTYLRVDPFHAFAIDGSGIITPHAEFIVSGWNDFFRPVLSDSRLVGIGTNDEQGWTLSVSLYDITDLTNPSPLVARADVEAHYSYSEASWDHRAFSVLEDAVQAQGPGGESETGLVLLPFSGWNDDWNTYTAGVQIFTFSASTLTRRDIMVHGTQVRRSFAADADLTGNLSEAELSLFDTQNPDDALELGRIELAPNYTDYLPYGNYAARITNGRDYYYGWWGGDAALPDAHVQIVARADNPDEAEPAASFAVPSDASVYKSGNHLVSVATRIVDGSTYPYEYESTIDVHDLTNPTSPSLAGSLTTDRLEPAYGYYWGYEDCFDCGGYWGGGAAQTAVEVPGGLAFLQRHPEQELLGIEQVCSTYPTQDTWCEDWTSGCTYYTGGITCRGLNGATPTCYGEIQLCTLDADGSGSCSEVDPSTIATSQHCYSSESYRYWESFSLEVLDLRGAQPIFTDSIELPDGDEGASILGSGAEIWISYKRPIQVPGDSRPFVRWFIRRIDLSDPASPVVDAGINVPGELLALQGGSIYTRDLTWGQNVVETAIARSQLVGSLAYLQAIRIFTDQWVEKTTLDGAGHVLVSHRNLYDYGYYGNGGVRVDGVGGSTTADDTYTQRLTILAGSNLQALSESPVADWATLEEALAGRALFQVPGGMLIFNLDDPAAPYAQAYFPTRGWPQDVVVEGRDVVMPAGRFGIYAFDLDDYNLLAPEL